MWGAVTFGWSQHHMNFALSSCHGWSVSSIVHPWAHAMTPMCFKKKCPIWCLVQSCTSAHWQHPLVLTKGSCEDHPAKLELTFEHLLEVGLKLMPRNPFSHKPNHWSAQDIRSLEMVSNHCLKRSKPFNVQCHLRITWSCDLSWVQWAAAKFPAFVGQMT